MKILAHLDLDAFFAAVEELDTKASPLLPDELVETTVAQLLLNGAQPPVRKVLGQDLG